MTKHPSPWKPGREQTNALMVVNGGYYSVENERYFPDGLTIVNGEASGRSFGGFGGMLAINEDRAELRWLVQKPYNSYEPLQAALQSFPILVQPGGELGFGAERENHVSARRTVIGQDKDGRILFIVAPQGYFTLHQLSVYLTESDLNLDIAVNLDGGGSTGTIGGEPARNHPPKQAAAVRDPGLCSIIYFALSKFAQHPQIEAKGAGTATSPKSLRTPQGSSARRVLIGQTLPAWFVGQILPPSNHC